MKQKITVEEQFSPKWKGIAVLSLVIAVLYFILFLISTDPFWKGIFRFIAFIGLVGIVFSFLRLREGQKEVKIELLDNQLLLSYYKKDEMLREEVFEQETIKDIYKEEVKLPAKLLYIKKSYKFFITFTDTDKILPFFEYSGRNLHFSNEKAVEIDDFTAKIQVN